MYYCLIFIHAERLRKLYLQKNTPAHQGSTRCRHEHAKKPEQSDTTAVIKRRVAEPRGDS